jgi:hypothetical protein
LTWVKLHVMTSKHLLPSLIKFLFVVGVFAWLLNLWCSVWLDCSVSFLYIVCHCMCFNSIILL